MNLLPEWGEFDAAATLPPGPVRLGSAEHLMLFSRMLLDTHDPYRPAVIDWPELEPEVRDKIVSLPIWDMAVQTEGRTGLFVQTFAETVRELGSGTRRLQTGLVRTYVLALAASLAVLFVVFIAVR